MVGEMTSCVIVSYRLSVVEKGCKCYHHSFSQVFAFEGIP